MFFFRNTDDIGLMDFGYTLVSPRSSGASIIDFNVILLVHCFECLFS